MAAPPATKPRSNLPKPRQPTRPSILKPPSTSTPTPASTPTQAAGSTIPAAATRAPTRSRLPTSASTLPSSSISAARRRAPTPVPSKPATAPPSEPPPALPRPVADKRFIARRPSQSSDKSATSAAATTPIVDAHTENPTSKSAGRARAGSHASVPSTPDIPDFGAGAYPTPPTSANARSRFGRPTGGAAMREREGEKGEKTAVQATISTPAAPFRSASTITTLNVPSPSSVANRSSSMSSTATASCEQKENRPPFAAEQAGSSSSPGPSVSPLPPLNAIQTAPPLREDRAELLEDPRFDTPHELLPVFSPSLWTLSPEPLLPSFGTRPLAFKKAFRTRNVKIQASVEIASAVPLIIQQLLDEVARFAEEWHAFFRSSCEDNDKEGSEGFSLGMDDVSSKEESIAPGLEGDREASSLLDETTGADAETGGSAQGAPGTSLTGDTSPALDGSLKDSPNPEKRGWRDIPIARDVRVSLPLPQPAPTSSPKVIRSVTIIHPRRATMVDQGKEVPLALRTPPRTPSEEHGTTATSGPPRIPLPPVPEAPSYLSLCWLSQINLSPILAPPPLELPGLPHAPTKPKVAATPARREMPAFTTTTTPVVSSPLAQTPFTARTLSDQSSPPTGTPSERRMVTFTPQAPPRNRAGSITRDVTLPPTPRSHQRPLQSQEMFSPRPTSIPVVVSPPMASRSSVTSIASSIPSSLGHGNAKIGRSASLMGLRSLFKRTSAADLGASVPVSGSLLAMATPGERARRKRAESLKGRIGEPMVVSLGGLGVQLEEAARKREGLGLGVGVEMAVVEEGDDLESVESAGAELRRGNGGGSLREQGRTGREERKVLRKKTR